MLIAQPGRMGPLRLRNRIIMGPMGTNYGTTDGLSTERDKLYYAERAIGGAAMIITEAMVVTEGARNHNAPRREMEERAFRMGPHEPIPGRRRSVVEFPANYRHVVNPPRSSSARIRDPSGPI